MFTGIVEEIGRIHHISKTSRAEKLVISCEKVLEGTKIGDSIAVNGTCLTVTAMDGTSFSADVTPETMRRTAFSLFRPGTPVNLERALRLGDRLGGHIMMGHVDGTGRILSMKKDDNAVNISISTDRKWMRYIIEKGSVAVDGISLTVAGRTEKSFSIALIPHTGSETALLLKHPADLVNLECDYLGKYVEQLLKEGPTEGLTMGMLETLGHGGHYGL
ncbi:riboflavin synthase [uncultured Dialister sp.]|uniref:riboflavin synthase n=1 Tax=uncultured Dialister sp. TaxID=278064 RepID=UPI0025D423E7|nr:riboflavin synthase [uncultured Dialister sp.]